MQLSADKIRSILATKFPVDAPPRLNYITDADLLRFEGLSGKSQEEKDTGILGGKGRGLNHARQAIAAINGMILVRNDEEINETSVNVFIPRGSGDWSDKAMANSAVPDQTMAELGKKGFNPTDLKRTNQVIKFFASDNPEDLFREQDVVSNQDWERFFENFGRYRAVPGKEREIDPALRYERIDNNAEFQGMKDVLQKHLSQAEAGLFITQLNELQDALDTSEKEIQEKLEPSQKAELIQYWGKLDDFEKIMLANLNVAVLARIINGSLQVSTHVATVLLDGLVYKLRRSGVLNNDDLWQILKDNEYFLSTADTDMRRAFLRAIYVGDYFQIAKRKNIRLHFKVETEAGLVEVEDEKFVIRDKKGNEITAATGNLERETLGHMRIYAMQYLMEGLERFPPGLISKIQEPMNFYINFDLTYTRRVGVSIAEYIPGKAIATRRLNIQIDGNPRKGELRETVMTLNHEITHYLVLNVGKNGLILPMEDYFDLIKAMGFKRYTINEVNGTIDIIDSTNEIVDLEDIYKYYYSNDSYFFAIGDEVVENPGTFAFKAAEFGDSLEKIGPLLEKLGLSKGNFKNIRTAVDWLNESPEPFLRYVDHIKEFGMYDDIPVDPNFATQSRSYFTRLARTDDGRKLKRAILTKLYPDPEVTPNHQDVSVKKFERLAKILPAKGLKLIPDNQGNKTHSKLNTDEKNAYEASEGAQGPILSILQNNFLKSSGPVAMKEDGALIEAVYFPTEADSEQGFMTNYRIIGKKKIYTTIEEAKNASAADDAMAVRQAKVQFSDTGGIDLTADKTPLEIRNAGQGIQFHIDRAMLQRLKNSPGFKPSIISIQPMTDIKLFLGLKESPQAAER